MGGVASYRYSVHDATKNREKDRVWAAEEGVRYTVYYQKLKQDPAIALLQGWYRNSGPDGFLKWRVYRDSLENPQIGYTPEEISLVIDFERKNSEIYRKLLRHPQLDLSTLEREYRLAFEDAARGSEDAGWSLIEILSLPQAKREWLLEVSLSGIADEIGILWKDRLRTAIDPGLTSE